METSPTRKLSNYLSNLSITDIPQTQLTRAKYLILDGVACALTGAHLAHSEKAANAMFLMESSGGTCSVIGYPDRKLTPLSAALLNSTFIQGFELDDWHTEAPLHSNSILIPALLAAAEHKKTTLSSGSTVSGKDILLAMVAGYETGPRVGNALYGRHMLSMGWHSGAVFGPAAAAAAVGKLYNLDTDTLEDAFGIACTQACGLMSAQFESEVKRMQHGFAARNGLFGALLAEQGYVGIKRVFEREYGGFLAQFSQGNGKTPSYKLEELHQDLGQKWQTDGVCVKPYAAMAGTHATVDCIRLLQTEHPDRMTPKNLEEHATSIEITLDEAFFHHGGFEIRRPNVSATGAQMSNAYVAATQLIDRQVLANQFSPANLDRDEIWSLISCTRCVQGHDFEPGNTQVRITFDDGVSLTKQLPAARGVDPPLSNDEIVQKWRALASHVVVNADGENGGDGDGDVDGDRRLKKIEEMVLNIDQLEDITELIELLTPATRDPLA